MRPHKIDYYIIWLQQENHKSFYLAFLRVAINLWLLKELLSNWPSLDILYGHAAFIVSKGNLTSLLPDGGFSLVSNHFLWVIIPYILSILLNILAIGRSFTALLVFVLMYLVQRMNMSVINGGDVTARLILFYLIFADSYCYFVLFKPRPTDFDNKKIRNLLSNLAAGSIMLQLCLSYFASGIAKLTEPLWYEGKAVYYALLTERFMGTTLNKYIVQYKWLDIVSNYGVLAFELLFPILIWVKKWRTPVLITGLFFHLCLYIFLMIYGFQVVFVLMYGFFLPNQKLLKFAYRCKSFFVRSKPTSPR